MEFNIRKNATLPYLEVNLIKSGRLDFRYKDTDLTTTTIYLYMKNVDTEVYKIAKGVCVYDAENDSIYYQFTKRNTNDVGRFEVEFKLSNNDGDIILPLKEKLYINILESFSNSDFCCGPNNYINPQPTPIAPGVYYGKFIGDTITAQQVIQNLTFITTSIPLNTYYTLPTKPTPEYGYILIPTSLDQPTEFRDSTNGCFGNNVPMDNTIIEQLVINDINGFATTYYVYRSYYPFVGQINLWLCN